MPGKALDAAEKLSTSDDEKESVWFARGAMYERMKKIDAFEVGIPQSTEGGSG